MSTFPRSGVVVIGQNAVQSLLPSTLISQAESLLENHRINDAVDLVEQQRRKLQGKASVDIDEVNIYTSLVATHSSNIRVSDRLMNYAMSTNE